MRMLLKYFKEKLQSVSSSSSQLESLNQQLLLEKNALSYLVRKLKADFKHLLLKSTEVS